VLKGVSRSGTEERAEGLKNCVIMRFVLFITHKILLLRSNQEGRDELGMQLVWETNLYGTIIGKPE
jgi:hypothetical protein